MVNIEANTAARAIPLTTISMIGVLLAFRRELFMDTLHEYAEYFNVTFAGFVATGVAVIVLIMIVGVVVWKLFESHFEQRRAQEAYVPIYEKERNALIALYKSMNGERWKDRTRWCSDEPINTWKGVKFDPSTKRVNKLILPENNMTGHIAEEIGDLEELVEIDFRRNEIGGPIPESMLQLTKLQGLYLFENRLTGKIPDELSDLPELQGVYLFNNNFEDSRRSEELFKTKMPADDGYIVFI